MSNIFRHGVFDSNAGLALRYKIECDGLSAADWECWAKEIIRHTEFGRVVGVPRGGLAFARALEPYVKVGSPKVLIVDDVLTTGRSMHRVREKLVGEGVDLFDVKGLVLFKRQSPYEPKPWWIYAVFEMTHWFTEDGKW